jgi:hypothetical protein
MISGHGMRAISLWNLHAFFYIIVDFFVKMIYNLTEIPMESFPREQKYTVHTENY